jgi:hypothetical protein
MTDGGAMVVQWWCNGGKGEDIDAVAKLKDGATIDTGKTSH